MQSVEEGAVGKSLAVSSFEGTYAKDKVILELLVRSIIVSITNYQGHSLSS